jgi:hypothetical protein
MSRASSTATSHVGSNIEQYAALAAYEQRASAARQKPLLRARNALVRDSRAFLTKSAVRRILPICRANRDVFDRALLRAHGNAVAIEQARQKARRTIDRALRQDVRGYAAYRAKQRSNLKAYRTLVAQHARAADSRVDLNLGAVVSDQLDTQTFGPPYPLFVVDRVEESDLVSDTSIADPDAGFVINNVTFHWDEHNSVWDELTGFVIGPDFATRASVGVAYTVPRTGRLTFAAVFQNLFNYVTYSLTDNLGFSDGEVTVRLSLFARVLRGDAVIGFERVLFDDGLVAPGGTDFPVHVFSGLSQTTPYTLSATTAETFEQGEVIQVLVGSSVGIASQLNDMESAVKATLAWQVKNIYLGA